jgi:signal transduction histidine kinase
MKLAAKLVSMLVVAIAIVLVLDGLFAAQREIELFHSDMRRDAHLLGAVLKKPIADAWQSGGKEQAFRLVADANQQKDDVAIRWVWLDTANDSQYQPRLEVDRLEDVSGGQEVSLNSSDDGGSDFLYTYVPVDNVGDRPAALEIRESLAPLHEYVRGTMLRTAGVVGVSMVVSSVGVVVLGLLLVGRPLHRLIEKARRVGGGDLSGPLRWKRHDELGELAQAMNRMCELLAEARERAQVEQEQRIALMEQVRHADRLRTVGRLAAGVAHELGTPLNTISIHAGMIVGDDTSKDETIHSAVIIKAQSHRMTEIIQHLLDYARRRSPNKRPTDMRTVAEKTLAALARFCEEHNAKSSLQSNGDPAVAEVDGGQMEQVLTNLLINAVQAMPDGGDISVEIRHQIVRPPTQADELEGDFVCIAVRDQGAGISEADRRHIFDPFFTTKDIGEGTGLGLSIAYGIVQEHGGWIDVASVPGKGSCFTVFLPASPADATTAESCT